MHGVYLFLCIFILISTFHRTYSDEKSQAKIKKDPRDFTENDVNNLFEQWEVCFIIFLIFIEIK